MIFKDYSNLKGSHAYFSASQPSWVRYPIDKAVTKYRNRNRTALGTELHEFAASQIILSIKVTSIRQLTDRLATFIFQKYSSTNEVARGMELIGDLDNLPNEVFQTLKAYINDAIKFSMQPEQILRYSSRFFGTADAISFDNNLLRIHDLKTGDNPAHIEQLEVYAALFCLDYDISPGEIDMELRMYQSNEVLCYEPSTDSIAPIIDKIITIDSHITRIDLEE